MRCKPGLAGALVVAGAAVWVGAAPIAAADSAQATINDLEAQGYVVAINWVDGNTGAPLGSCHVVAIPNPDSSPTADSTTATTVYVDLSCPRQEAPVGIGFGVG